ncbi:MAG: transposase [Candidatus Cloacimonetes bacterium]|nr:transposase [Candidatus Cloacimonadota bacterium]
MKKNDNRLRYRGFYRRNLPHIQPRDGILFITYRLYHQLPERIKEQINKIRKTKCGNSFEIIDNYLDLCKEGPKWLKDDRIANVVRDNLLKMNKVQYELYCFCIMPNHVHVLLKPKIKFRNIPYSLAEIFRGHKGVTARKANLILHRSGQFWHAERYDHYIRDDEDFYNIAWYIIMNPVKAKLVKHYREWKFTWIEKDLEYEMGLDMIE